MARYSAGARSAGAGSTTLPIGSLYAAAAVNFRLREIGVFNTTATACALKLVRLSTAGTQGSGLTESPHDASSVAASCTAFNTHTVAPTIANDLGYNASLGAAIGSGIIWTFGGDTGINVNVGTGNGVGIIVATGTGQICDFWFMWDE
jgi:hypothetical protein